MRLFQRRGLGSCTLCAGHVERMRWWRVKKYAWTKNSKTRRRKKCRVFHGAAVSRYTFTKDSQPSLITLMNIVTRINLAWLSIDTIHATLLNVGLTTAAVELSLPSYDCHLAWETIQNFVKCRYIDSIPSLLGFGFQYSRIQGGSFAGVVPEGGRGGYSLLSGTSASLLGKT